MARETANQKFSFSSSPSIIVGAGRGTVGTDVASAESIATSNASASVPDSTSSSDYSNSKSKIQRTNKKNPLNSYRSYTYLFTLAALSKEALNDPSIYI